jgi:hypothetical protein
MGKHDELAHNLHISKKLKFQQPRPTLPTSPKTLQAPQTPQPGSQARNQYR